MQAVTSQPSGATGSRREQRTGCPCLVHGGRRARRCQAGPAIPPQSKRRSVCFLNHVGRTRPKCPTNTHPTDFVVAASSDLGDNRSMRMPSPDVSGFEAHRMNGVRSIRAGPLRDTERDQWTFDSCLDWPTGDGLLVRVWPARYRFSARLPMPWRNSRVKPIGWMGGIGCHPVPPCQAPPYAQNSELWAISIFPQSCSSPPSRAPGFPLRAHEGQSRGTTRSATAQGYAVPGILPTRAPARL
jgi:hypothetical protein